MATLNLNLNHRCTILLFDQIICSATLAIFVQIGLVLPNSFNHHWHRLHLSKQSFIKRIRVLQDENDITIQKTSSETKLTLTNDKVDDFQGLFER